MAFQKTLAHRFLYITKTCSSHLRSSNTGKIIPESDSGLTRRFLHEDPIPPDRFPISVTEGLVDRVRILKGHRIRLDCVIPPKKKEENSKKMSMEEVKKVMKAVKMEMARSRLRSMEKEWISYSEFLKVCHGISSLDQGLGIAKALDESGVVIVLGNVVLLRPDQVAKAVESVIPLSIPQQNHLPAPQQNNNCRREELRELQEQKAAIDKLAETSVKRELWCGLGFMLIQTIGLMRLTFWELSWDVMEPICFYLASMYFLAGYGFFIRTSREPSFESFFRSRFDAKQKRLMEAYNFDLSRFNELKKGCTSFVASFPSDGCALSFCDCRGKSMQIGILH